MRVVLSGYYGFGNLGDEAVLAAMLSALRPRLPDASFVVLSGDPASTAGQHAVTAVSRIGPAAFRALAGADLFLSGGGSLIQDTSSVRSPLYYLGVLRAGTILARRTMMFAQGVGPIRRRWIRALTGWVCERADVLTVRDEDSRRLLFECGVRRPVEVVADPVFALPAAAPQRARELLGTAGTPRIGVALRPWGDNGFIAPVLAGLRTISAQTGAEVVVLVFHPAHDAAVSAQVARACSARTISGVTPQEMLAVIGSLDLVVGARLHALICAAAAGVAAVGLVYDPKIEALWRQIENGTLLPVGALTPASVTQALTAAWATKDAVRPALRAKAASLRTAALRAADLAAALAGLPFRSTE